MDTTEMAEIIEFISKNINEMSIGDISKFIVATEEFVDKIRPLYLKYASTDEKATFIVKL